MFDCGRAPVAGRSIADLVHRVDDNGEAFVARFGKSALASAAISTASVFETPTVFYT